MLGKVRIAMGVGGTGFIGIRGGSRVWSVVHDQVPRSCQRETLREEPEPDNPGYPN
jgi:hypothetical protein